MKFMKNKGYEETTLCKVCNDDKTVLYGVVGTVGDFSRLKILDWCDYDKDLWLFLPERIIQDAHFGKTRSEACEVIKEV